MIQRIQSIYLLVVTILQVILLFSTIITATVQGGEMVIIKTLDYVAMAAITAISALLAFFTIFIYRKRIIQIRLTIYNLIILLILQGFFIYYMITVSRGADTTSYSFTIIFPFISAILSYLAIRNIAKDEALIKALDRIR